MPTTIAVEQRGHGTWITLDRPAKANALSPQMIDEIAEEIASAAASDSILVITGAGDAFCAGADLAADGEASDVGPDIGLLERSTRLLTEIEEFPNPVIAAVNGTACAGGLELVLCCDLVYAAQSARLGDVHAKVGLLPGAGGAYRLPRRIPHSLAAEMLFTGDLLSAQRLYQGGLVNHVVADEQLIEAVDQLVERLGQHSPLGLRRMKRLMRDGLEQHKETALGAAVTMNALHLHSYDSAEGLAAFASRRPAKFEGR